MSSTLTRTFTVAALSALAWLPATAAPVIIPAPPQISSTGYILMDADTGKVLVEHNADEQLPPASLTKMMTSYIVSGDIESGKIGEQDLVEVSVKAWRMGGSKMFIREGTQVPVIDLLRGVIIQSGNDASVALAEHVAGSEDAFVDIMNQQAALLGMTSTHYKNATGWPAEGHLTTARDLSLLAQALINHHPEHYALYSEKYFSYNGINQPNRNKLLFTDDSIDGIKTGHTDEAGYCLVASGQRDGMRLISVVMGTRSEGARANESQKLLAYGFRYFQTHTVYAAGEVLSTNRVWGGQRDEVQLGVAKRVALTIPRGAEKALKAELQLPEVIKAPLSAGQQMGRLTISLEGETLYDQSLVVTEDVAEAGFFARLWDGIKLFFFQLFN
ncbi:D-alanyl-D-alanine carboxypeptidase family protein [Simiduia aestuariiviva]|uniref:serine-type D-Ala-D-Ala carboxypeptidase n=1 Tax=Simiduia aestuariiviva TaxID=1510459 RepID=A0A839UM54_9GAMM|nr:D-alanyl-D-alanine carboxypeptidase family protein [Simiduia aestuariiviva]MBB3169274.1 D-alanyl-D-alanine carboxypeptidase (penicillin-binding protein 5/6) [Simiduia aestuariiviva]